MATAQAIRDWHEIAKVCRERAAFHGEYGLERRAGAWEIIAEKFDELVEDAVLDHLAVEEFFEEEQLDEIREEIASGG